MMPVSVDPAVEALTAIVSRINSGSGQAYTLTRDAAGLFALTDQLTQAGPLQVDVLHVAQETLQDTLDIEDRTSHDLEVWVRKKLPAKHSLQDIGEVLLVARQIFQRLNGFATSRVQVWDCGSPTGDAVDKEWLNQSGVALCVIRLRVEVEATP